MGEWHDNVQQGGWRTVCHVVQYKQCVDGKKVCLFSLQDEDWSWTQYGAVKARSQEL